MTSTGGICDMSVVEQAKEVGERIAKSIVNANFKAKTAYWIGQTLAQEHPTLQQQAVSAMLIGLYAWHDVNSKSNTGIDTRTQAAMDMVAHLKIAVPNPRLPII